GGFVGAHDGSIDIVLAGRLFEDIQCLGLQLAHVQLLPIVASLSDRACQRWAFVRLETSASVAMRQTPSMVRSISQSLWPSCAQSRSFASISLSERGWARLPFAATTISLNASPDVN